MTYETFLDAIPDYAKDLKLNLTSLLKQAELTEQQTWGTVIAAGHGHPPRPANRDSFG